MRAALFLLDLSLSIWMFLVMARVAWSWAEHFPENSFVRRARRPPFAYALRAVFASVDPLLRIFRRRVPLGRSGAMLDAGPVLVFLTLALVQAAIRRFAAELLP